MFCNISWTASRNAKCVDVIHVLQDNVTGTGAITRLSRYQTINHDIYGLMDHIYPIMTWIKPYREAQYTRKYNSRNVPNILYNKRQPFIDNPSLKDNVIIGIHIVVFKDVTVLLRDPLPSIRTRRQANARIIHDPIYDDIWSHCAALSSVFWDPQWKCEIRKGTHIKVYEQIVHITFPLVHYLHQLIMPGYIHILLHWWFRSK